MLTVAWPDFSLLLSNAFISVTSAAFHTRQTACSVLLFYFETTPLWVSSCFSVSYRWFLPLCVPPLTHLTCSQFPRQRPSVYSPGSPSCVCQFVPWCFPPLGRPVLRFPRCRPAFCFSVSSRLALVCFWLVLFSLNLCFVFVALCLAFWTVFLFSVLVSLVVLLVFCSPISCLPHESAFVSSSSFSL